MGGRRRIRRGAAVAALAAGALGSAADPASAAGSAARTLSRPVVVPSAGGVVGRATLAISYRARSARATASSASLALPGGRIFYVGACVSAHVAGRAPVAGCHAVRADLRLRRGTVPIAPVTAAVTTPRPARGNTAYADGFVSIAVPRAVGGPVPVGDSWPRAGLPASSLPVFAAGAASGPLPHAAPDFVPGDPAGVNTATPDSMCLPISLPAIGAPPDGLSTTALGGARNYYEVGEPTARAPTGPRGIMLVVHGGSWFGGGPGAVASERSAANWWRAQGWRTVNLDYRPCGNAAADVVALHDRVRRRYGARIPVCALGASAGGQLVLDLALARRDVRCVIDQAGPTNPAALLHERARQPGGARGAYDLMAAAYGAENLRRHSAVARARTLAAHRTRVLVAVSRHDPLIPTAQAPALAHAMARYRPTGAATPLVLAAGRRGFVHAGVSSAAIVRYHRAQLALVAPLARAYARRRGDQRP